MYKKILTYFKKKGAVVIVVNTILFLFVLFFFLLFLYHITYKHNVKVVYDNLKTVDKGEDIKVALKKVKRGTILLQYSTEECLDCYYLFEKCPDCDSRKDISTTLQIMIHFRNKD